MASATLNSLMGLSKPAAAPAGAGSAGPAIGPGQIGASVASASGGSVASAASSSAGAESPTTINDFLAMLSQMIESPALSEGAALPAVAVAASGAKPTADAGDAKSDSNLLLAQLLAFMQSGGSDAPTPQVDTAAVAADATQSAVDPASGASQTSTASALLRAFQSGASGQRQLIAKLLGQARTDRSDTNAVPASDDGSAPPVDDKQTLASTLQNSFQGLLAGRSDAGAPASAPSLQSLQDLTALLGQANASPATQSTPSQIDPSLLQSAIATSAAAPAAAPVPTASQVQQLQAPVGSAAWTDQLGTHLTWMATNDQQSASLKLTPPHLGPLEIQITVGDDNKASVWFSAPHADTRAALGDALPRLRELFGAGGLTLADANVSREPSRQNSRSQSSDSSGSKLGIDSDDLPIGGAAHLAALHAGILDTYA